MASKHMVTCVQCGKRFDANHGGYYNKNNRRYTCKACGKAMNAAYRKQNAEQKAAVREEKTGMRQSIGAMIAKIAFGLLFIFAGFSSPDDGWTFSYFLTAIVIGAALIAWGLIPYLNAQKVKKTGNIANEETVEENEGIKTCASCGATGYGKFCEYCGKKLSE